MLNEALNVVAARAFERAGEIVMLKELLEDGERALVIGHTDEERVVRLAEPLRDAHLRAGDSLLLEPRSRLRATRRSRRPRSRSSSSRRSPTSTTSDIGGLAGQIEQIRDAVELPFLHPDLFAEHKLRPAQGDPALRPARAAARR